MATDTKSKYIILEGSHVLKGKVYKKGQVISHDKDLSKMFPEKFSRVGAPVELPDPANEAADNEDEGKVPASGKINWQALFEDMRDDTKSFADAKKANLQVLCDEEGQFFVVDPKNESAPLNEGETLSTAAQTSAWLKKYLKG